MLLRNAIIATHLVQPVATRNVNTPWTAVLIDGILGIHLTCREHGVVGDMRDAWPSARVRKNVALVRTYHGFKGT